MTQQVTCRLCGSSAVRLRIALDDYAVFRCRDCSAVFTDVTPEQAAGLYSEEYFSEEFAPYFAALFGEADDTPIRRQFERYLDMLEGVRAPGRLLDVGCAAGLFLDVARGRGWSVEGIEISEHAASVARDKRGVEVTVGDVMHVTLPPASYDVVSMLDVLEHITSPGDMLERARELLRPGGILLLVLPNDRNLTTMAAMAAYRASFGAISYPASRVHQVYHVTYFTQRTITELLGRHGFEVATIAPDETVRGLINESAVMKAGVSALFAVSRLLGLQNKMVVLARPL